MLSILPHSHNMSTALLTALLTSFLLPLLASSCPLALFACEGQYHNTSVTICSNHKVQCVRSVLRIQFNGIEPWYETGNILLLEKTFKVFDPHLASNLQQKGCDFLYNFTNPIHGFYPSSIPAQIKNFTLFNCSVNSYNFSRDVFSEKYGCSYRGSYHLCYSYNPGNKEHSYSKNCSRQGNPMVEWELAFSESPSGVVDFSLLSVALIHNRTSNPECFRCMMWEGKYSTIDGESSECSCQLDCRNGRNERLKRKLPIAFGSLVVGFLLALCVVYLWLLRQKGNTRSVSRKALVRSVSTDPSPLYRDPEALGGFYHTPIFTYEELHEATGGFDSSKELGDGGFGVVYKGFLKDGRVVAVKRLHERNYRRVQQFRNEVEILNRIRHPNLVSLYGCTTRDSRELLLVYEYVPNGTLADHLNGPLASENLLTWPRRLSISVETAAALAYLHATQPQIIHRDVKTSNILLDGAFHVKVADFGLSRLFPLGMATHVSTAPQGTPGYVDPEYHQCYQLTDKSDVYSFGVVLVELISSKPAVDIDRPRSEINLSNIAMAKIPRGLMHELVDPTLGYDSDLGVKWTIDAVAELAFRCLQPEKDMRPSMDEARDTLMQMDGGDHRKASPEGEYQTRDDTSLLKSSESAAAFSLVTVIGN